MVLTKVVTYIEVVIEKITYIEVSMVNVTLDRWKQNNKNSFINLTV